MNTLYRFAMMLCLAGCDPLGPVDEGETAPANGPDGELVPGIVQGRAVDTQGRPLADVEVIVDNTLYDNTGLTGRTDADGRYAIAVPDGAWRVYARLQREYRGRVFTIELAPAEPGGFSGADGAIRDFEWRLTGEKPAPLVGLHGGTLYVWVDPDAEIHDDSRIELELVPVGPLIDGSEGAPQTVRPEGGRVEDVPLGAYALRAWDAPQGRPRAPLRVRVQDTEGAPSERVEAVFEPLWARELCHDCLRIELSRP